MTEEMTTIEEESWSDVDLVVEAVTNMLAVISPRQLWQLSQKVRQRGEKGFGRVTMEWFNGKPNLLIEEYSDKWR